MATINDILTEVDAIKPNQYDDSLMIGWISNLEYKIIHDVIDTHELNDGETYPEFDGYTDADISAELIVPDPYSELYKFFIMAQIDFYNNETARYANNMLMYNNSYMEYVRYYNRNHMPKSKNLML